MKRYRLVPCISAEELQERVARLAAQINHDYAGKRIIAIGILKGAFIFLSDLIRKITVPVQVDFVRLASYGFDSQTSGEIRISKDIELSVTNEHVLIVEDIVDTGITLEWFLRHLRKRNPRSIRICALVDKLERRQVEIPLDYTGIQVEKGFLVGYGLDFAENHRNLSGICEVEFLDKDGSD